MQATIAMIDWLTSQLRQQNVPKTTIAWTALGQKPADSFAKPGRETQLKAVEILNAALRDPDRQRSLRTWVQNALGLSDSEANEVLWHPPRPLLLAGDPHVASPPPPQLGGRRGPTRVHEFRDLMGGNPLPDFFPMNLFSELALPETFVSIPPQTDRDTDRELQAMGLGQMLREYAPGRVSRRFATRNLDHRHWIPVPIGVAEPVLELTTHPARLRGRGALHRSTSTAHRRPPRWFAPIRFSSNCRRRQSRTRPTQRCNGDRSSSRRGPA